MNKIFHIGLAVPNLDKGLAEIGELFDLTWRPVITRSMTIKDGFGDPYDVDCHVTFSVGGPFAVEMWQGIPDTPLETPASGYFHHIGYWVDDYAGEKERLHAFGYPPFLTSEPTLQLSRGPGNICIEPCDLERDQPYLRDLFPTDSPFAGDPVFPSSPEHPDNYFREENSNV